MKTLRLVLGVLLGGILLVTTACDNKKTSRGAPGRIARGGYSGGYNNAYPGGMTQNPNYGYQDYGASGSQWAYIRGDNTQSFYGAIQGLVSASMNPSELGNVTAYGDVAIIGSIEMNRQGQINPNNSRLRIEIWDDYARMGQASEIALAFNAMSTYTYNGNQLIMHFNDQYGEVIISGQFNQSEFIGTLSFQNSQHFDGTSRPASGVIGTFQVPTNGFFRQL